MKYFKKIAILGGGPSGLFMFKRLVESGQTDFTITVFERQQKLGAGMPYSAEGAGDEHITNVSSNEIPMLVTALSDWIKSVPKDTLDKFNIDAQNFNEYKVLPRLLFGQYLRAQFQLIQQKAKEKGIEYEVFYNSTVTDIIDIPSTETTLVEINENDKLEFDQVVVCTGHQWPRRNEGKIAGYFDSPYPPQKLALTLNHPIAIKGSSLTAVDAIRTLSRNNGAFSRDNKGELFYEIHAHTPDFKMILHSRNGMLPAVRFHLEDSHLINKSLLTEEEIKDHINENDGFLSLDYIFEHDFKLPLKDKEPEFYDQIKDMHLEDFVEAMMELREELDPFRLLKSEYIEAEKSIRRKKSIYWKEMLGVLSFAINYPAKYLSAEDMERLRHTLNPLISVVIAYIPQSSSEEMLALNKAGILSLLAVGDDGQVEAVEEGGAIYHYHDDKGIKQAVYYNTYIDCVGQPHIAFEDFPFRGLLENRTISPAKLRFRSAEAGDNAIVEGKDVIIDQDGHHYLKVPGITINDHFQVVDGYGAINNRIYMMAVPYIGGYNPDYSGLDFGEAASALIVERIFA